MINDKKDQVKKSILTSREVLDFLGIKRSRLSQLVKAGKLTPIKKSVFLLDDILERKAIQEDLRKKYYRPKE